VRLLEPERFEPARGSRAEVSEAVVAVHDHRLDAVKLLGAGRVQRLEWDVDGPWEMLLVVLDRRQNFDELRALVEQSLEVLQVDAAWHQRLISMPAGEADPSIGLIARQPSSSAAGRSKTMPSACAARHVRAAAVPARKNTSQQNDPVLFAVSVTASDGNDTCRSSGRELLTPSGATTSSTRLAGLRQRRRGHGATVAQQTQQRERQRRVITRRKRALQRDSERF